MLSSHVDVRAPSLTLFADALGCPVGSCGTTATRPRPRSGETPSHWWITGHSTPYAPQACISHRPLGEQPVDVGPEVTARDDLRHRARHLPQIRIELAAGVACDVDALLIRAKPAVVALAHRCDGAVEGEDAALAGHRGDHRVAGRTAGLPSGAEVGPVPVW